MTLEEMEAELGEVKAEIKKRRRAGAGWLPLTLALLMCLAGSPVEGFTAYDCSTRATLWKPTRFWNWTPAPTWGRKGKSRPWYTGRLSRLSKTG